VTQAGGFYLNQHLPRARPFQVNIHYDKRFSGLNGNGSTGQHFLRPLSFIRLIGEVGTGEHYTSVQQSLPRCWTQ
jgi:hypothetical protein